MNAKSVSRHSNPNKEVITRINFGDISFLTSPLFASFQATATIMVDGVVEDVAAVEEAMTTATTLTAVDAEVVTDAILVDMIIVVLL